LSDFGTIFCLIACLLALILPKKWLFVPIMASVCYMTVGQMLNVGGVNVFAYRLVLIFACIRAALRGELRLSFQNKVDRYVIIFCACAIVTGIAAGHLKSSIGSAGNILGFYLIFRSIASSIADTRRIFLQSAIIVVPLAMMMIMERISGNNPFANLGGVPQESQIRQEKNRAQGPFRHPILAGTAGALTVLPLILLFKEYRVIASVGIIAGCAMIIASSSSGPYVTLAIGGAALGIYKYRKKLRSILRGLLIVLCCLEIVMKQHVWFLMARLDLVGGSTGWHRAQLLSSAFNHINEWWLCGTAYTRHWMPTGVSWNVDQTDITNQYIFMGVEGGLALMITFIVMLVVASKSAYKLCLMHEDVKANSYLCWTLWAMLAAQMVTFLSIGYFDQIITFMCLNLALIASLLDVGKSGDAVKSDSPAVPSRPKFFTRKWALHE
jgi:hypothetical protein